LNAARDRSASQEEIDELDIAWKAAKEAENAVWQAHLRAFPQNLERR
jgi:hypothetical protein